MNLLVEYKKGQEGKNKGIPLGEELKSLSAAMNGLQKGKIIGVAAPPKVGKSTFVDYAFVIQPYLYHVITGVPIDIIYYSFEMDRVTKEFDFASFFLSYDYKFYKIPLGKIKVTNPQTGEQEVVQQTRDGENFFYLNSAYLRGRYFDDDGHLIKVHSKIEKALKEVYQKRIIPLFGEYDEKGRRIKKGLITFIENKDNPTGIYKDLHKKAAREGEFLYDTYERDGETHKKIVSYTPNNPYKTVIVVVDHVRAINLERGWTLKQNIDKLSQYMVIMRNRLNYTFVPVIHTNRNLADNLSMKHMGEYIYPTPETIKDSGNLSEDCDILLTMFNPNDTRYNLDRHFNFELKDSYGDIAYPFLRTIHIAESRYCEAPQHFRYNMFGNIKTFKKMEE